MEFPLKRSLLKTFHRLMDNYFFWNLHIDRNIEVALRMNAVRTTADYVEHNMLTVRSYLDKFDLMADAVKAVTLDGLFLEFGVFTGGSINFIAKRIKHTIHGFDSFEGLPEDWFTGMAKGVFDIGGKLPPVEPNVALHKGWFDQTLPEFLAKTPGDVAFLHVDSDLYSSAVTVFTALRDRIKPQTIILFDEYFNYAGWRDHEFKAFHEFIDATGLSYRYLGYTRRGEQVAVRIEPPRQAGETMNRADTVAVKA